MLSFEPSFVDEFDQIADACKNALQFVQTCSQFCKFFVQKNFNIDIEEVCDCQDRRRMEVTRHFVLFFCRCDDIVLLKDRREWPDSLFPLNSVQAFRIQAAITQFKRQEENKKLQSVDEDLRCFYEVMMFVAKAIYGVVPNVPIKVRLLLSFIFFYTPFRLECAFSLKFNSTVQKRDGVWWVMFPQHKMVHIAGPVSWHPLPGHISRLIDTVFSSQDRGLIFSRPDAFALSRVLVHYFGDFPKFFRNLRHVVCTSHVLAFGMGWIGKEMFEKLCLFSLHSPDVVVTYYSRRNISQPYRSRLKSSRIYGEQLFRDKSFLGNIASHAPQVYEANIRLFAMFINTAALFLNVPIPFTCFPDLLLHTPLPDEELSAEFERQEPRPERKPRLLIRKIPISSPTFDRLQRCPTDSSIMSVLRGEIGTEFEFEFYYSCPRCQKKYHTNVWWCPAEQLEFLMGKDMP